MTGNIPTLARCKVGVDGQSKIVRPKVSRHRYGKSSTYLVDGYRNGLFVGSEVIAKPFWARFLATHSVHVQQNPVGDHHQVANQRARAVCAVPSETQDIV